MNTKLFLIFFFSMCFCKQVQGQTDTLFWFAAPEVTSGNNSFDRPIVLRITAYSQNSTVTITQPANPTFPTQSLTISAGSMQTVDLTNWIDSIENKPADAILNFGLKISATSPVTIYYEVVSAQCSCNPEIFVLKGRNALGVDFWIPSQNYLSNSQSFPPISNSSFDIVATQNNTTITITPSNSIIGHSAGVPFTKILNIGQTYSATASSGLAADHLQGSRVASNKPIAITIKDDVISGMPYYGTCSDLGGDQIVPTPLLGTEYVAMDGFLNTPKDQVFVLATQNGTSVSQDGNFVNTINTGQTLQLSVGDSSTYINTSSPVYVVQISGYGCEMGIDILPPIICTGSYEVALTRSSTEPLYVNLLVHNGGQNNFLVNGNSGVIIGSTFKQVPGTSGQWLAGQVSLPAGTYPVGTTIIISNSISLFHASVIHGGSTTGTRFGYFSNFSILNINASVSDSEVCVGSTIFFTSDTINQGVYSWIGPSGFASNIQSPSISNVQVSNSGNYIVSVSALGCPSFPDTVHVTVHQPTIHNLNTSICQGNIYTFPSGDTATTAQIDTSILVDNLGCDSIIITNLVVISSIIQSNYDTICQGSSFQLPNGNAVTTQGIYYDTLQTSQGCDSIIITNLAVISSIIQTNYDTICQGSSFQLPNGNIVTTQGIYYDTLQTSQGCDSVIVTNLSMFPQIHDSIMTSNISCYGGSDGVIQLFAFGGSTPYIFQLLGVGENSSGTFNNLSASNYSFTITDNNGCTVMGNCIVNQPTKIKITVHPNATTINANDIVSLVAACNYPNASFFWSPTTFLSCDTCSYTTSTPDINVTYHLTVTVSANGVACSEDTTIIILIKPNIFVPNAFTPNDDGLNDFFQVVGNNFDNISEFDISIYNRWGQRIFQSKDIHCKWDGTFKEQKEQIGVYVYVIKYKVIGTNGSEQVKTGNITILR